jgi:hypothetical protein
VRQEERLGGYMSLTMPRGTCGPERSEHLRECFMLSLRDSSVSGCFCDSRRVGVGCAFKSMSEFMD